MKLTFSSIAKLLLPLSVVIAGVSGYQALQLGPRVAVAQSRLAQSQTTERGAREQSAAVAALLQGNEQALPLERALTTAIAVLQRECGANRVTIGALTPKDANARTPSNDIAQIGAPVADSRLRYLTIEVKGSYRDYRGLLAYVAAIQKLPIAVTRLVVDGNGFALDVEVYGQTP